MRKDHLPRIVALVARWRGAAHGAEAGDGGEGVAVHRAAPPAAPSSLRCKSSVVRDWFRSMAVANAVCQRRNSSCQHRRRRHP